MEAVLRKTLAVQVYARSRRPAPVSASKFSAIPEAATEAQSDSAMVWASSVRPARFRPSKMIMVAGAHTGPRQ